MRQSSRESALVRASQGIEEQEWGLNEHLLAHAIDVLQLANWQRENEGRKSKTPRPKRVPRPGSKDEGERVGKDPIPISEFDDWWNSAVAATGPSCSVDGCDNPPKARTWCGMHYSRWRRHGDPLTTQRA